ncbi:hypothetical protein [Parageobacillus thermoglucosidasius]|jgi:hypothetical protein|uniref:hypothetical protein n=1 Tax=Parageobacillus thermoglucosidasius TaxID=1426 RepID=UPI000B55088E|nr:hypothetical protein [Parageobacillus thermoglucosidasius]OUM93608.1 MAG: hypothetical protein BAA00_06145 [Parageobacillus thermoglucosidasius]
MNTQAKISYISDNFPYFTTIEGEIPFWDHPMLKGEKVLPKKYFPYTRLEAVLDLYRRGLLDEKDITLLKVLGDAVCANEDQLRRYMAPIMSRSDTSKRLDRFRTYALVERWKVRIRGAEEEVKPPAPFTLGVAGYKLLKHFYNSDFFMNPELWDNYGIGGIKRYVAMNELRCIMTEKKIAKKWKWHAVIANNPRIKYPMGTAEIRTPQGNLNFLIDRAQMNQNFIGFIKERLEHWKKVYESYGNLPVSEFPVNPAVVVIYTATLSMAEFIHNQILLDSYPYRIWVCVEEHLVKDGFETAFYVPRESKLQRIKLDLF